MQLSLAGVTTASLGLGRRDGRGHRRGGPAVGTNDAGLAGARRGRSRRGAGARAPLGASGHRDLLGAASLPRLQLGRGAGGEGALGFAAGLAGHLLARHHNTLRCRAALHPRIDLLARGQGDARGSPPVARRLGRGRGTAALGAAGALGASPAARLRAACRHPLGRARSTSPTCGNGRRGPGNRLSRRARRARRGGLGRSGGRGRPGGNGCSGGSGRRSPRRSRPGRSGCRTGSLGMRPPAAAVAASRIVTAPDNHLHLGHLATFRLQAVGHTAHTAVERGDPQAQRQHGYRQHAKAHGHQTERRRQELKHRNNPSPGGRIVSYRDDKRRGNDCRYKNPRPIGQKGE